MRVYCGDSYTASTDPATVPDEDIVYETTGIVVAGSSLVADEDYDIGKNHHAVWDARKAAPSRPDGTSKDELWVSYKSTAGTAQASVVSKFWAEDTE